MLLLYTLVTGIAAAYCLLAIWVAIGPGHWFARGCVLLAALALLVPIRAYEPLILFGMTSVLLVGAWGVLRFASTPPASGEAAGPVPASRYRFHLFELFLACVIAAAISWLVREFIARGMVISWWRFGLAAVVLALMSSLAVAAVRKGRRWITVPLAIVATAGAVAVDFYWIKNFLGTDQILRIYRDFPIASREGLDQLAALYVLFAAWTLIVTLVGVAWSYPFRETRYRRVVRSLIVAAAAPSVVLVGSVYWHMLGVPSPPVAAEQDENQLPRVIELSQRLAGATPKEAEAIYAELLPLLKRPAAVSIDWASLGRDSEVLVETLADVQVIRAAARQMDAECQRLGAAGRHDEAGEFALAIIRCGDSYRRGGLIIDFLVGEAITGVGQACLARCRTNLSPAKALEAAQLLETISANQEPLATLLARDALWSDLEFTWRHRLSQAVEFQIWGQTPTADIERMLPGVIDRVDCESDLLSIDLALRAYVADHGDLPAKLDDLTPRYLSRVPPDRYSGQPYLYRRSEKDYLLYSVGKDGRDDGGKFANYVTYFSTEGYDYDLETMIRP